MIPNHAALVRKLLLIVAAASLFGFALVPLYNVLCEATGFNGKTAGKKEGFVAGGLASDTKAAPSQIDRSRLITVEFTGTVMPGLPWEMRPLTTSLETHPGEMQQVRYLVRNTSDRPVTAQAVPSVTPGQAAQHFEKIECFCFTQQALGPGESKEMPLVFVVKPDMGREVRHITLSYAFFSIDGQRQTLTATREIR
ncbi:MAG TPA: cytochrome c oxidase assembly protein [Rhodocyclaceae bacterium]|nr:cytochrome c oxidase assembly protein [Rhodocyclaceae bacterium]